MKFNSYYLVCQELRWLFKQFYEKCDHVLENHTLDNVSLEIQFHNRVFPLKKKQKLFQLLFNTKMSLIYFPKLSLFKKNKK